MLTHARLTYDQIFKEVDVSQYVKNTEAMYLYNTEKDYNSAQYSINLRKKNGITIKELNSNEIKEMEPNIAPVYYKGILFEGKILETEQFESIASLPSREELLSQFVGTIQSPLTGLVRILNASMSNLVGVLSSLKDSKNN